MPAPRTIGVDIGGTRLLAGAVDAALDVHHRTQRAVSGLDQSSLLDAAADAVEEARSAAGAEIGAVGFGFRDLGDEGSGGSETPGKPALRDVMAERIGLPAFVDTAANVAALAEHRAGAARGVSDAVVITIDAGIRAGLILDGDLRRDRNEQLGTDTKLVEAVHDAAEAHPESVLAAALREGREPTGALVTELAHDGDAAAIEALATVGRRLGSVVTDLVSAYRPELVVVGGGLTAAGELLLGPARAELTDLTPAPGGDQPPIVAARFGVDAVIVGAAALAFEALERGREAA
jgi:glucokinase